MLKSQDVLICVYLASGGSPAYTGMAAALGLGLSTTHRSVQRASAAKLLDADHQPIRANLLEFLQHGLRYVFYAELGGAQVRGVASGAGAPELRERLASTPSNSPVWPSAKGRTRGVTIAPLHSSVPDVALANPSLHTILAAIDLLRVGTARERAVANELLAERLG